MERQSQQPASRERRIHARELSIADLLREQYGVVSRAQLLELGLAKGAIDYRVRHRRLIPVHYGVYTTGSGMLIRRGRWLAAVLAGGEGAL